MKLKIICMGNTSESYLQTGIDRYLGRLKHYAKVEWLELPEVKQTKKLTEAQIIKKEADLVRNQLTTSSYLVLIWYGINSQRAVTWFCWMKRENNLTRINWLSSLTSAWYRV